VRLHVNILNPLQQIAGRLAASAIRAPYRLRAALLGALRGKRGPRIAVNLGDYGPSIGGVGNYALSLIRAWPEFVPSNPLRLYCTKQNFEMIRGLPLACRLEHHFLHDQSDLVAIGEEFDIFYCPLGRLFPVPPPHPCAFHLGDIQDYFLPELFTPEELSARRNRYRSALAFADRVLVPSEFTRRSMIELLGFPPDRVEVVALPSEDLPAESVRPPGLTVGSGEFVYYPADDYAHKNHRRLFGAIRLLVAGGSPVRLVCSGGRLSGRPLADLAAEFGLADRITDLGKVSRREVAWLYRNARLLAFPSLFEGFGIPLLEAFSTGLPVVCSGVTSLPEIAGEAALYCDPFDPSDIARQIGRAWDDPVLRASLVAGGSRRRDKFKTGDIVRHHEVIFGRIADEHRKGGTPEERSFRLPDFDPLASECLYRQSAVLPGDLPARADWFGVDAPPAKPAVTVVGASPGRVPPVHFFTIVLDGMPFIRHHIEVFRELPIDWHWHVIEGVAELAGDTAWSVANGGHIPQRASHLSTDGTSAYLDALAAEFPDRVTVYRKPGYWRGKLEMIAAPLAGIRGEAILWQVDADELWSAEQITRLVGHMASDPARTGAKFYCRFFVGPDRVLDNLGAYGNDPASEWRRVWRLLPGDRWETHEPPRLVRGTPGSEVDVIEIAPFTQRETLAMGLVFDHHAYGTEDQVRFKEAYYGYAGAVERWRQMRDDPRREVLLNDFFPWVKDPVWAIRSDG